LRDTIVSLCDSLESKFISMRRTFHRIPEPSFGELKTQARLCSYLKQEGIAFRRVRGTTGVLGLIKGSAGRTIALRSDMDALNITERTGLAFASRNKGHMHACGHDAHMAMMIGAGLVLKRLGRDLPGQVRLIFQPAEETPPGGALTLIRHGALRKPKVSAIIGTHVVASVPSGKVAFNTGTISAGADDFSVTILGKGGHGSKPQEGVDAIAVAAQFISTIQTIVSRRVSPLESVVVSIGRISGGERHNIIADRVTMDGTIRTKSTALRRQVPAMIRQILKTTCSGSGAKGKFEFVPGYPPVVCDDRFGDLVRSACIDVLGRSRVTTTPELEMGGEDFAYYARKVAGTIIFVGASNKRKGKVFQLHHSRFDIDEDALKLGVTAIAYSAYRYLAEGKEPESAKRK
jgi:amidohydrolase